MLQPSEVDIQIEVAVLKNRLDHIDESIDDMKEHLSAVDARIMRVERTVYMLLGGLVLIQFLPMVSDLIATLG